MFINESETCLKEKESLSSFQESIQASFNAALSSEGTTKDLVSQDHTHQNTTDISTTSDDEASIPRELGGDVIHIVKSRVIRTTRGFVALAMAGITIIGGTIGVAMHHTTAVATTTAAHVAAHVAAPPVAAQAPAVVAQAIQHATIAVSTSSSYLLADGSINFSAEPNIPDNYQSLPKDQIISIFNNKENFIRKVLTNTKTSPQTMELYQDKLSVLQSMRLSAL